MSIWGRSAGLSMDLSHWSGNGLPAASPAGHAVSYNPSADRATARLGSLFLLP